MRYGGSYNYGSKLMGIYVPSSCAGGSSSGGSSSSGSSSKSCLDCLRNGGGRGCASRCPQGYSCQTCIKYGGGYGCRSKCSSSFDEAEEVGGGRVYGEYNKGPVKVGGEWNFDEEDQSVGWYDDQPSHTKPHMPDGNSMGNWINFRL